MKNQLVNRVAQSSIITLNLENYFPEKELISIDITDYLFQGLILKEKDFRNQLKSMDWSLYSDKVLLVYCSNDAIIPVWSFMLITAYAKSYAHEIYLGTEEEYLKHHYYRVLEEMDFKQYTGARVVIKGCSSRPVPPAAYAFLTDKLHPYAQSIMYGEPCSTVPIFKRPRNLNVKN